MQIHPDSEATEFALELSSLLKELSCPYTVLVSGQTAQRFQTRSDRLLLLNYLISELMAAKMSHKLNPQKKVIIEIVSKTGITNHPMHTFIFFNRRLKVLLLLH